MDPRRSDKPGILKDTFNAKTYKTVSGRSRVCDGPRGAAAVWCVVSTWVAGPPYKRRPGRWWLSLIPNHIRHPETKTSPIQGRFRLAAPRPPPSGSTKRRCHLHYLPARIHRPRTFSSLTAFREAVFFFVVWVFSGITYVWDDAGSKDETIDWCGAGGPLQWIKEDILAGRLKMYRSNPLLKSNREINLWTRMNYFSL